MSLSIFKVMKCFFDKESEEGREIFPQKEEDFKKAYFAYDYYTNEKIQYNSLNPHMYVYKYTALRADCVYDTVRRCSELRELFNPASEKTIKIACLGSGPGSELLGILKYIQNEIKEDRKNLKLECHFFDKYDTWDGFWNNDGDNNGNFAQAFDECCESKDECCESEDECCESEDECCESEDFLGNGENVAEVLEGECESEDFGGGDGKNLEKAVTFTVECHRKDLSQVDETFLDTLRDCDLFIMSYVLSEIFKSGEEAGKKSFVDGLVSKMKDNALIILVDNNPEVNNDQTSLVCCFYDGHNSRNKYKISEGEKRTDLNPYVRENMQPQLRSPTGKSQNGMIRQVFRHIKQSE